MKYKKEKRIQTMNKVNEKAKLWRYKKVVGPIYFYLGHNIDVHKTLPFYKLSTQMEFLKKTFQEVRPELVPLALVLKIVKFIGILLAFYMSYVIK